MLPSLFQQPGCPLVRQYRVLCMLSMFSQAFLAINNTVRVQKAEQQCSQLFHELIATQSEQISPWLLEYFISAIPSSNVCA